MKRMNVYAAWRMHFIVIILGCLFGVIIVQAYHLAISKRVFLKNQGDFRALRAQLVGGARGMIVDRYHVPLAISSVSYAVWLNPMRFSFRHDYVVSLARVLGQDWHVLARKIGHARYQKKHFLYLVRVLAPYEGIKVRALHLKGVHLDKINHRYYPQGEIMAPLLGGTNVDDRGLDGLEYYAQKFLSGHSGRVQVERDGHHHVVFRQVKQASVSGHMLRLTLDQRISALAYRVLVHGVANAHAHSGSVIVVDVPHAELLAIANVPSFNPNKAFSGPYALRRNRAFSDLFEPGSTLKPITLSIVMQDKKVHLTDLIDTQKGHLVVQNHLISDEVVHQRFITVQRAIQKSSNVALAKLGLSVAPLQWYQGLQAFHFGVLHPVLQALGSTRGRVIRYRPAQRFSRATQAFGYGVSTTLLQLAQAYHVIADGGVFRPLRLIMDQAEKPSQFKRVLPADLALKVRQVLATVTEKEGTGHFAHIKGYRIAGKTGTANVAGAHGYTNDTVASFVGFSPVLHPKYLVAVVIRSPDLAHQFGGQAAAPICAKIMENIWRINEHSAH
jgi:cell division protein FtsI (penicillin-binding protein 3)